MNWLGIDCEDYAVVRRSWQLCAICIVVLSCAVIAYLTKSRGTFGAGLAGVITGIIALQFVPLPRTHVNGTLEGVVMFHLNEAFDRILTSAAIGMLFAMSLRVRWRYGCWFPSAEVVDAVRKQQNSNDAVPH